MFIQKSNQDLQYTIYNISVFCYNHRPLHTYIYIYIYIYILYINMYIYTLILCKPWNKLYLRKQSEEGINLNCQIWFDREVV